MLKKCSDIDKVKAWSILSAASGVWKSLESELFVLDAILKEVKCKNAVADFHAEGQFLVELKLGTLSTGEILAKCTSLRLELGADSDLCMVLFYSKTETVCTGRSSVPNFGKC